MQQGPQCGPCCLRALLARRDQWAATGILPIFTRHSCGPVLCTEVPLVLGPDDLSLPLLDSLDVLASQCVRYSRRELELPNART